MTGSPPFVGRRRELSALQKAYRGRASSLIPIYGRRRVGKTELIKQFLGDRPAVYYLAKRAPAGLQLADFLREAAAGLDLPVLASLATTDWKAALKTLADQWGDRGKLVLVLDELQWLVEASPELPSVLQELWDRHWRDSGRVMLILCGSFVGFMEREVMGRKSPLFGRRTGQILLRPFNYREAAEFHPSWSLVDRARVRFVCGGVPLYLRWFAEQRSVEQGIRSNLLDPFGPLFREADFLLREELREVDKYYAVLVAIATGQRTRGAIAARSGVPAASLQYYLQQLCELGYVARRHPLVGKTPVKRHVRYAIEDPLLRFWFRFVFPNTSSIERLGPARSFDQLVKPELEPYFGGCFERLCREALGWIYASEGVTAPHAVGEYWDSKVQIDVVGLREDGWTDLGECKWGTVRSTRALRAELEAKVSAYPNARGATIGRRYFARKLPARRPEGGSWYTLEDLYALED